MAETTTKLTAEQEQAMINDAYRQLLDSYLNSNHRKKVEIIERAFKFACQAHAGVRRRSGEPYIMHPIAVATIVSREIGLGSTSICAALLHDVVEDTDYTVEDITRFFGEKIAEIVDGLTKISGGIFGDHASAQAENFRKLLLTMSNDWRVILIKMADRLHNMRTLASMPPAKQYKIAGETLYIYAPLAHRLGLFAIKTELEDLSFKYEHPDIYKTIGEQIEESEKRRNDVFESFSAPIRKRLDARGLQYEFKARVKSRYSIWKKMEKKHIPFNEVYDLYAARIVFECPEGMDEKRMCWNIYSDITDLYRLHPDRIRDWISTPKANGYRALHITVMGPDGNWVEVQIRSRKMDDIAERGFAAHWKYKIGSGEGEEENELNEWLKNFADVLKNPEPNALDFLDTVKLNLFAREISVFTPKGEIISLPVGASVLDLAFTLHSQIGTHCIAGKVNHKLVPLSQKLQSGDQVEIITSRTQRPKPEWIDFVVTAKGKTRLKAALRHNRRGVIDNGDKKLRAFLAEHDIPANNETMTRILSRVNVSNKEDLFFKIGSGELTPTLEMVRKQSQQSKSLFSRMFHNPFSSSNSNDENKIDEAGKTETGKKINTKEVYVLKTVDGKTNYQFADCCNPVPGDDVLGYVNEKNELIVHKMDCPVAMKLKSSFGSRLVQTRWENTDETFLTRVHIEGLDRQGILQEIIYIISTHLSINMRELNIRADEGVFHCDLDVLVSDVEEINRMCKRLRKVKGVSLASRAD
ncbi:MAG: bifunctional (p)ppGpp synthetase/guanosine-3',5'-bis(diphosphate) 3'-pyrophosphohydrolase [Muribaculaceae bacterium]|nr:bifunctional (p)ppGpp synthetase/guanosine-3',5'-bis(diphosphate) 3'-pyrophosphohydrolase [Muribaculaceae bacterium]